MNLRSYILLNCIAWVYLAIIGVALRLMVGESAGVFFFFIMLALGFSAVTVFDLFYDRLSSRR